MSIEDIKKAIAALIADQTKELHGWLDSFNAVRLATDQKRLLDLFGTLDWEDSYDYKAERAREQR